MKKIFSLGFLFAVFAVAFISCKKDSTTTLTTLQKIQYKWTFVNQIDQGSTTGTSYYDKVDGLPGDYYQFNTDNTVDVKRNTSTYSLNYQLRGNDTLIFISPIARPDTMYIRILTASDFQLFKGETTLTSTASTTINLSK